MNIIIGIVFVILFFSFLSSYPIPTLIILGCVLLFLYVSAQEDKKRAHISTQNFLKKIDNNEKISWHNLFANDLQVKLLNEQYNTVAQIIESGISKGLFYGEISNLENAKPFLEIIKKCSLEYLDKYAKDNNLKSYSFVDIRRTSQSLISVGTYIYIFTENEDLLLLKAPFSFQLNVPIFNLDFLSTAVLIKKESIKDFQVFGTQLMETETRFGGVRPGISTVISEVLLGPSYTLLKGLSSISLNSSHTINDARVVQVILNDKSDIEFGGISIYYDFNRRLGNIKNKEIENSSIDEKGLKNIESLTGKNYINDLRELKLLLDENIITQEDFDSKKKELLNLK